MKKRYLNPKFYILKFTLIFFVISILMGVGFGGKINAQDADVIIDRPNQGFTISKYICPSGYTHIADRDLAVIDTTRNQLMSNYPDICFKDDKVGGITRYRDRLTEIEVSICEAEESLGLAIDGGEYHSSKCCNISSPYYYDAGFSGAERCCKFGGLSKSEVKTRCPDSTGEFDPKEDTWWFATAYKTGTDLASKADRIIVCEANGCISDSNGSTYKNILDAEGRSITENNYSQGFQCTPVGGLIPEERDDGIFIATDNYCIDGSSDDISRRKVDQTTVDTYGGINQYMSCIAETDDKSKLDCLACFEKNESGQSAFVWTSLGCVDTSKNGFVTRVYQIGLGIVGGFGVWKIMSAAFMYQQADPAKHEQAREEITSVFWALILMVGAIFILNFIGVNVLGIFSSNLF